MNEQIHALAVQAGMALKPRRLYDDNEPDGYLESDLDYFDNNLEATRVFFEGGLEKFAELIVQDCISKLAWVPQSSGPEGLGDYNQGWVNGRALAVEHIKEHFGVK